MVIKVYISGISGNKEVKKRQQRVMMILESKNISYEVIDITEPGKESDKEFMQQNSKPRGDQKHPLPPQIFNEEEYCGHSPAPDTDTGDTSRDAEEKQEEPDKSTEEATKEETDETKNDETKNGSADVAETNEGGVETTEEEQESKETDASGEEKDAHNQNSELTKEEGNEEDGEDATDQNADE